MIDDRPRLDRDNDGLCDDTEREVTRTDPDDPDTDGDGFIDGFEYSFGSSPLRATSPEPERVLTWREQPGERIETVFTLFFRGNGQAVFGAFYESPEGVDGLRGEDLGVTIEALAAVPPSNAPDRTAERFVSVLGATRLTFRIVGEWPSREPLRCRRAYVLYPSAYAEELGLLSLRGYFVDVRAAEAPHDAGPLVDGSSTSDALTSDASEDAGPRGPWPYQRDGYCLPRPGFCR
jgi:hypothetical protein